MFKIKLLISLLASLIFISCANSNKKNNIQLSISYIGGEYDGLLLSNKLKGYLNNFGMLNENSIYEVRGNISHTSNLFVTNIDNTSDRENISSSIELKIYDKELDCYSHTYKDDVSQYYVLASSDKFMSNSTAVEEIKAVNTDNLVRGFVNSLNNNMLDCKLAPYELRLRKLKKSLYEK